MRAKVASRLGPRVVLAGAAFLCLPLGSLLAHDTWLSPSAYSVVVGQPVTFELTSGMKFPALETGPKPERIAQAGYRSENEKGQFKDLTGSEEALRATVSFAREGVATVWFEALPKKLDLTDEQVEEYLEEIRAPAAVRTRWEQEKGKSKWQESYIKSATTFVAVGDASGDQSWKEPIGLALEMVPLTNPATATAGQKFSVRLLQDGKAVPQASIALIREQSKGRVFQVTDAEGIATFVPEKSGKYLLTCVLLEPTSKDSVWNSRFSTLTMRVKPEDSP